MTGGSYGGQIQFAAAGLRARGGHRPARRDHPADHLERPGLLPGAGEQRLPGGTAESGSVSSTGTGVFKYQWAALFTTRRRRQRRRGRPAALARGRLVAPFVADGCANFEPAGLHGAAEVGTLGYPSQASIDFLRSNSVASYMDDIRVPTLIGQGQADTLFNLQESVATYTALKEQGTPVSLVWQSWGHSDSSPVAGRAGHAAPGRVLPGPGGAGLVRALRARDRPGARRRTSPTSATGCTRRPARHHAGLRRRRRPTRSARSDLLPVRRQAARVGGAAGRPTATAGPPRARAPTAASRPIGPNYSETSALDQSRPVTDPPGTAIRFASAAAGHSRSTSSARPRLTVQLDSPDAPRRGGGPDGPARGLRQALRRRPGRTPVELPHRLISPVRVADVTRR